MANGPVILRGRAEVEAHAVLWGRVGWTSEQAEHAYFLAEPGEPLALIEGDAALVGRVATRPLDLRFGYLRVPTPPLRILRVVDAVGDVGALARLALREVDVVQTPALPVASETYRSLAALQPPRFIATWTRRRIVLPASFDAFLAGLGRKTRAGVRYDAKRLEAALDVRVEIVSEPDPSVVERLDEIARTTYQRRLGAGFSRDRSAVLLTALAHGWARVYLLWDGDTPVAFWWCGLHDTTIRTNTTGYLASYAQHRPGIYLLMRVIEDAIADPALEVLDFGPGRSGYKQRFANDGYDERNLLLFAPRPRARLAHGLNDAVRVATTGARFVLDRTGATQRLKTAWRRRLRR
ncbi:MAG: GNAT family N-acetyltransferase [Actinomycetota bacterium]